MAVGCEFVCWIAFNFCRCYAEILIFLLPFFFLFPSRRTTAPPPPLCSVIASPPGFQRPRGGSRFSWGGSVFSFLFIFLPLFFFIFRFLHHRPGSAAPPHHRRLRAAVASRQRASAAAPPPRAASPCSSHHLCRLGKGGNKGFPNPASNECWAGLTRPGPVNQTLAQK